MKVRDLGKVGLAILIGVVAAVALGEGALRAFAAFGGDAGRRLAARDPLATTYVPYGRAGYRPRPGATERFGNGAEAKYNRLGYRGPVVDSLKPPGTFRVVLLGGSTAAGFGVADDETIDAFLRRSLRAAAPGRCVEVVSLALGGYDSYQDFERFRVDGARLHPDVVIVHTGINDVRNSQFAEIGEPPDRRTLIWESSLLELRDSTFVGRSWRSAKHYLLLARLPALLREMTAQHQELGVIRSVTPHNDALDYFETNVRRTVELALEGGAAVILSVPPSALGLAGYRADGIERSYWIRDAATTEDYRMRLAGRLARLARTFSAEGAPVEYVEHRLPLDAFLDDAHLTALGNSAVARGLADVLGRLSFGEGVPSGSRTRNCSPE